MKPLPAYPPTFHVGQAVVCIDPTITHEVRATITCHLNMSTVYQVLAVVPRFGKWFLTINALTEFVFEEIHFAPAELLPDAVIAALLEATPDPVPV
jgi:hypothetical protein